MSYDDDEPISEKIERANELLFDLIDKYDSKNGTDYGYPATLKTENFEKVYIKSQDESIKASNEFNDKVKELGLIVDKFSCKKLCSSFLFNKTFSLLRARSFLRILTSAVVLSIPPDHITTNLPFCPAAILVSCSTRSSHNCSKVLSKVTNSGIGVRVLYLKSPNVKVLVLSMILPPYIRQILFQYCVYMQRHGNR